MGLGVVLWSIATILTPIAARVGFPFLLLVRAFMGIGEGVVMPAMNNKVLNLKLIGVLHFIHSPNSKC